MCEESLQACIVYMSILQYIRNHNALDDYNHLGVMRSGNSVAAHFACRLHGVRPIVVSVIAEMQRWLWLL